MKRFLRRWACHACEKRKDFRWSFFMSSPGVFYFNQSLNVISVKPHNRPLCIMLFEHFSEAKALSIIRAFEWHFSGKLGSFLTVNKNWNIFEEIDDFKNNSKNYIQFHLNAAMLMIFLAVLKLFICLHCCHTPWTFLLALNPLKMFRINKEGLSVVRLLSILVTFLGTTEHFSGKNGA